MSGEPKTLTLTFEETVEALGREGMEFRVESPTGKGVSWGVHQWSKAERRVVLVCCCYGTWPEAASDALDVRVVARDEAAELREENKRLSALVDDLLLAPNPLDDENMRLRAEAAELRAAIREYLADLAEFRKQETIAAQLPEGVGPDLEAVASAYSLDDAEAVLRRLAGGESER